MERDRKLLHHGDVYSLVTPKGLAYLQFVEWPMGNIPCFRILQGTYEFSLENEQIQQLAHQSHRFITFIPFGSAKKDPDWCRIGSFNLPQEYTKLPPFVNDSWQHLKPKRKLGWGIVTFTSKGRESVSVENLNEEQKDYPEEGVPALDLLAERIASGWRPRDWYEKKRWK